MRLLPFILYRLLGFKVQIDFEVLLQMLKEIKPFRRTFSLALINFRHQPH
jgi:hypothetical protein